VLALPILLCVAERDADRQCPDAPHYVSKSGDWQTDSKQIAWAGPLRKSAQVSSAGGLTASPAKRALRGNSGEL
jgi:hypothetical protein